MRRSWGFTVVAALVVAGACSDGREGPPGATMPPGGGGSSTSSPATTLNAASYEVPEVIDQAYVQRVVSAYDKVLGDAIRLLKRDGGVSEEFLEHLVGIYTEQEYEVHQQAWFEEVAEGRVEKTAEVPDAPVTSVIRLDVADSRCVIVRAERDYRRTLKPDVEAIATANDQYLVLVRKQPNRDPAGVNPTPWVLAFDGSKNDNSVPRNSCGD